MMKQVEPDHLKEDLLEMKYGTALVVGGLYVLVFLVASLGAVLGGKAGQVLVIVVSLPFSLFVMPVLDIVENPVLYKLILFGVNFFAGLVFWFLLALVVTNFRLFLSKSKLEIALVVLLAFIIVTALVLKELRGYGFFIGREGTISWKEGLPKKRVFVAANNSVSGPFVGGIGWLARFSDGRWQNMSVPGKLRKIPGSIVSLPDGKVYAKYRQDVYEIDQKRWKKISLKRSSGSLAVSPKGEVMVFSVEGVSILRNGEFVAEEFNGDCVPNEMTVFTSTSGDMWFGGKLGSIACTYDGKRLSIVALAGEKSVTDSATAFAEDMSGTIYFGTETGDVYRISGGKAVMIFDGGDDATNVNSLIFDQQKRLVVSYRNTSPARIELIGVDGLRQETPSIQGKYPCCLLRDLAGNIWIGDSGGMMLVEGRQPVNGRGMSR